MLGFLKKSVDEKEIIEIKKKIAYIETDMTILKAQYEKLLGRYKIEAMADARQKKKEDDVDIQKIITEISSNPNMSIQEIIMKNPKSAEPIPATMGIIRPIFAIKNTGRTILLFLLLYIRYHTLYAFYYFFNYFWIF